MWGDKNPRPTCMDPVPGTLAWDHWLGVAAERPFINGYSPPRRMAEAARLRHGHLRRHGCPILDPVYGSLALTAPLAATSHGDQPNADSWGLETMVVVSPSRHEIHDG